MKQVNTIWSQELDGGLYRCSVVRRSHDLGDLTIWDSVFEVIHREIVALAYGALFGPDVDDVFTWQERCIEVIDHPEKRTNRVR